MLIVTWDITEHSSVLQLIPPVLVTVSVKFVLKQDVFFTIRTSCEIETFK